MRWPLGPLVSLCFLLPLELEGPPIDDQKKSSFSRYIEYAETPFARPSYFSVPYRATPLSNLQFMSNEMFAHLLREHVRHQQRIRLLHQQRQQQIQANGPILAGVSRITELRQTPYRRYSQNSTVMTYEEKRRRWKEDLKNKMRGHKSPPRPPGSQSGVVGTAGRYYITFNPYSNAYQVSRRVPSYVKWEEFENAVKPDDLLSTPVSSTTTTTPIVITQETIPISNEFEQSIRVPAAPKLQPTSSIRQLLNLDYYDDNSEKMDETYDVAADNTATTTAPPPTSSTTTQPLTTQTTTTRLPTTEFRQIVYPVASTTSQSPTTKPPSSSVQTTRSLFGSYEDEDEDVDEDNEDFFWFKPGTRQSSPNGRPPTSEDKEPGSDPFRIIVHGDQ